LVKMAEKIVIDATDMVVGRLANKVAKLALNGNEVIVINCEKAVFSGKQHILLSKWKVRMKRVQPFKGPFIPRMADRVVKFVIRGMLPHAYWSEGRRGRMALSRIMCYIGTPDEFKTAKLTKIEGADASSLKTKHQLTVGEMVRLLRG